MIILGIVFIINQHGHINTSVKRVNAKNAELVWASY